MAICYSIVRTSVNGFVLVFMLFQLLAASWLCFYAVERYAVQLQLADNYVSFYKKNVELEERVIQAQQPRQLIATLPCLSAQFYQVMVVSQSLKLTKIIAVPYTGECRGRRVSVKYGVQAIY